ncbi:hypothetical protein [Agarivorans sp. QJM3NY_25]|uniref:hypothetical protein n=1 Tax=Agarivorans sp. QJM3NY_25 TaxID=3421430 RepID=UPI003D7D3538
MNSHQVLPLIINSEHFMPERQGRLSGQGGEFIASIRAAEKAGGMWLAFQDSNGHCAISKHDLVSRGEIKQVDWLSRKQIIVEFNVTGWGLISTNHPEFSKEWFTDTITAQQLILWPTPETYPPQPHLQQALLQVKRLYPELHSYGPNQAQDLNDVRLLCWRWLELLPLSIDTKQRLLKAATPALCIRYLNFILRQNDRFLHLRR